MKIPSHYHSAFKEELDGLGELDYYTNGNSIAIVHDINTGIIDEFYDCDVIYSEPAWRNGYSLFQDRAGHNSYYDFGTYLESIKLVINKLSKPTFIIGGKHMLKKLNPDNYIEIRFNGFDAIVLVWNYEVLDIKSNIDLINIISNRFNKVLDFSCGYGSHLGKFQSFVCSDLNKKCIYYIAKTYLGYHG